MTKCNCGRKAYIIETKDGESYINTRQTWLANIVFLICGFMLAFVLIYGIKWNPLPTKVGSFQKTKEKW